MAKKPADELKGMSSTECPVECNAQRCVITQVGICGHPLKGGLQSPFLNKPEVVGRYQAARKKLAKAKIDISIG